MADPISLDWEYVPEGWRPTEASAEGWNHPSIVERQRHLWTIYSELIRELALSPFASIPRARSRPMMRALTTSSMTFAYVLARAAHRRDSLAILDWGRRRVLRAYGTTPLAGAGARLRDQGAGRTCRIRTGIDALGQILETDEAVCFSRGYDLVLASSSIQYAQDWQALSYSALPPRRGTGSSSRGSRSYGTRGVSLWYSGRTIMAI